jgi:hypothetical protein
MQLQKVFNKLHEAKEFHRKGAENAEDDERELQIISKVNIRGEILLH